MRKKYMLTNESITIEDGTILYRIKALRTIKHNGKIVVKRGQLGGFVESEKNLSHEGACWVANNAKVFKNAQVFDNAQAFGDAQVFDWGWLCEDAKAYGHSKIHGNAQVFGQVELDGTFEVKGNDLLCGAEKLGKVIPQEEHKEAVKKEHEQEVRQDVEDNLVETKYKGSAIAARWWAKQLSGPTKQDAGLDGKTGDMFSLLMMLKEAGKVNANPQQIKNFEKILATRIDEELQQFEHARVRLMVDYDPIEMLRECAQEVGIAGGFPIKTCMTVTRNEVEVSHGYGAPMEVLYREKTIGSDGGRV